MSTGQLSNPNLQDAQKATFAASVAIQAYVATIMQQPIMKLSEMPNLPKHQEVARDHALDWNESILPEMIKTNADIIDYAKQYDEFHDTLAELADKIAKDSNNSEAKDKFIEGLTLLRNDIAKKRATAMTVKTSLEGFNGKLLVDHTTFQDDAAKATKLYEETDKKIAELSGKIDEVQGLIRTARNMMILELLPTVGGAIMIVVGAVAKIEIEGLSVGLIMAGVTFAITGALSEVASYDEYKVQTNKLKSLETELEPKGELLAGVKTVKEQVEGLIYELAQAIAAVDDLIKQWSDLDKSLDRVITDVDKKPGTCGPELKGMLDRASQDWKNALSLAEKMQPNGKLPIKTVTNIQDIVNMGA